MITETIDSVSKFHSVFGEMGWSDTFLFRGLSSPDHALLPSFGRMPKKDDEDPEMQELRIFEEFMRRAHPYLGTRPIDAWEALALAQHHGLPTRLMDWTTNPLVAAFFSTVKKGDFPSVIYMVDMAHVVDTTVDTDPFSIDVVERYTPPHLDSRIAAQQGVFTVHPNPQKPFTHPSLRRWIIEGSLRRTLRIRLDIYGINQQVLFPGFDGIAQQLRWEDGA